jgi:SRSO17 transposase
VDPELYVPRSWTRDPDRCQAAGLGDDTVFATKPELAARRQRPYGLLARPVITAG